MDNKDYISLVLSPEDARRLAASLGATAIELDECSYRTTHSAHERERVLALRERIFALTALADQSK